MCGGTAGDIIEGAQKEADKAIKGAQKAADSAINQATGNTGGSSGGKGAPVTTPVFNMPSFGGIGGGFTVPEINLPSSPIKINIPTPNLDQDLMDPVEDVVNQVTPTVESVVNTVTDVADTTSNVVQDIVNMDPSPPDYRNAPVPDLMPVVNDALLAASSAVQPALDLTKIDYARPFNELLDNTNELLGTTLMTVAGNVEPALDALSDLNPFGGTGGGSGGGGGGANYQLDASDPNLGDDQVFGDLEKATGKGSKLTEEERLRRIRRLLLNRYGREDTILTTGPGDTKSRRRYAL